MDGQIAAGWVYFLQRCEVFCHLQDTLSAQQGVTRDSIIKIIKSMGVTNSREQIMVLACVYMYICVRVGECTYYL